MAKENEQADIEIPENESFEGIEDAAELKAKLEDVQRKHREAGIRNRERTKALKEQMAALEAKMTSSTSSETKETKSDEFGLLEKSYLRTAGITDKEEIELAKTTSKKWSMPIDELVDDPDFKVKLDNLRTAKSNQVATSHIRGEGGSSVEKDKPEYWLAKGELPERTPANRKLRAEIIRKAVANTKNDKKFYND